MTSPVANTRGDDVTPDYSKGIAHVRLTLDELRERKLRTDELCDVRRIKLQQLLQLKQSERDAEQVEITLDSTVMAQYKCGLNCISLFVSLRCTEDYFLNESSNSFSWSPRSGWQSLLGLQLPSELVNE